jgi:protein-tyrosine phosphatase
MQLILDKIDTALDSGQVVYVHCFAGLGRTGTVVGCYLARHGISGEAALTEIARLRQDLPTARLRSPEVEIQRQMVRCWPVGQ